MNFSASLPIFLSKENITNRFVDYSNVYILPPICLFGILTSIGCLVVSFERRAEASNKTLEYIFLNSLIDLIFLLIQSFLFIFRCGALCPHGYTYAAKFYEIYIYLYVGYILVNSQVFLNIYVSIERLRMISGKLTTSKSSLTRLNMFEVYAICLIVSVLSNAPPYLMAKQIAPLGILVTTTSNSTINMSIDNSSTEFDVLYMRTTRKEFQTSALRPLLTLLLVIKDPLMYLLLSVINVLVCVKFRKFIQSKRHILSNNCFSDTLKIESNFTRLSLLYCLIFFIGNFVDSFSMVANVFSFDIYVKYGFINITGNCLFFASHGAHFFLCLQFNSCFRKRLTALARHFRFAKKVSP